MQLRFSVEEADEAEARSSSAGSAPRPRARAFAASTARYHDLSIAVAPWAPAAAQVQTFHLPPAAAAPFTVAAAPGASELPLTQRATFSSQ